MEGYSLTVFFIYGPQRKKDDAYANFSFGGGGGGGRWANKVYCGRCANGEFRVI